MTWRFTAAGWLMLGGAAFFALTVGYVWRRRGDPLAVSLLVMLLAALAWSVAYALELSSATPGSRQLWGDLKYVGICLLPPAWLAFVFHYLGRPRWPTRLVGALLVVEPLAVLVLLANDTTHDLVRFYTPQGGVVAEAGPLFWAHLIYTDVLLWAGTAVFVVSSWRLSRLYRRQAVVVFVSVLLPWAANLLYNLHLGPGPFRQVDLSPFAFTLTAGVLVFGVFRFGLLDQRPLARSQIFETIPDPVLVLDPYGRVIDANPAAARLVGRPVPDAVGQPAVRLVPELGDRAAGWPRAPTTWTCPRCRGGRGGAAGSWWWPATSPSAARPSRSCARHWTGSGWPPSSCSWPWNASRPPPRSCAAPTS
jgi:PAS domain-containing protein